MAEPQGQVDGSGEQSASLRPRREAVMLVTGDFPPDITGMGDYTRLLVDALAGQGIEAAVLTGHCDAAQQSQPTGDGRVVRRIRGWRWRDLPELLHAVDRLDRDGIVHIQYPALGYRRHLGINFLPLVMRLLRRRHPVVVTIHEFRVMRRRWRIRSIPMLLAAHRVVIVDPLELPSIARWIPAAQRKTEWIPIASNMPVSEAGPNARMRTRAEIGLPGDDPIVVFFGGVYEHKGVDDLVQALARLRATGSRARLLVVGEPGPNAAHRRALGAALAETLGHAAVWLTGASPEQVSRALAASDVAALPFHGGALQNRGSLLACLEHRLPVLTTRTDATPASFGESTGMLLVPPRDVDALVSALDGVLRDEPLRRRLADAAGCLTADRDTWSTIAAKHVALYRDLWGARGKRERTAAVPPR